MSDVISNSQVYFRDGFVPFDKAVLSIASAPVLYGLSIYTVFPAFWNGEQEELYLFRLADHFKRLINSAGIMSFAEFPKHWDAEKFETIIKELMRRNDVRRDSMVRVNVFVDDILKGTRMHGLRNSLSAMVYPAETLLPRGGAELCVSSWRRTPDNAIPSRAKVNGSYANASLMKHEAVQKGFDDAIALDEQGHVAESTISNVFVVRHGRLFTPGVATDLMEGLTRDTIFSLARNLGLKYEERLIDRSELYVADEIFLCGSSVHIVSVKSVDHRKIGDGRPGKITKSIQKAYDELVRNMTPERSDWLTPVYG